MPLLKSCQPARAFVHHVVLTRFSLMIASRLATHGLPNALLALYTSSSAAHVLWLATARCPALCFVCALSSEQHRAHIAL